MGQTYFIDIEVNELDQTVNYHELHSKLKSSLTQDVKLIFRWKSLKTVDFGVSCITTMYRCFKSYFQYIMILR